jgi:hypothetical protein
MYDPKTIKSRIRLRFKHRAQANLALLALGLQHATDEADVNFPDARIQVRQNTMTRDNARLYVLQGLGSRMVK